MALEAWFIETALRESSPAIADKDLDVYREPYPDPSLAGPGVADHLTGHRRGGSPKRVRRSSHRVCSRSTPGGSTSTSSHGA